MLTTWWPPLSPWSQSRLCTVGGEKRFFYKINVHGNVKCAYLSLLTSGGTKEALQRDVLLMFKTLSFSVGIS